MGEVFFLFENFFYNGCGGGGDSIRDIRVLDNGFYLIILDV